MEAIELLLALAVVIIVIAHIAKSQTVKKSYDTGNKKFNKFLQSISPEEDDEDEYCFNDVASIRNNNRFLTTFVFVKMNDILKDKFDIILTEQEKSAILVTFHAMPDDKLNDLCNYVKKHPFISAWLATKIAELYKKKRDSGEKINAAEIGMIIFTAKTLGGE
jgi:DNA replicative helicase MCM subunit Mcm2 (Cdc46/Mcm family)